MRPQSCCTSRPGAFWTYQNGVLPVFTLEPLTTLYPCCSGHDFDASSAKRLALTVLEAVLQTQLGVFFAANFAAGFYATFFLITKTLFLGQLTASESAQLAERLLKLAVLKAAFLLVVQSPGFGSMLEVGCCSGHASAPPCHGTLCLLPSTCCQPLPER